MAEGTYSMASARADSLKKVCVCVGVGGGGEGREGGEARAFLLVEVSGA